MKFLAIGIRRQSLTSSSGRVAAALAAAGCRREPALGRRNGQLTVDVWRHEGASLLSLKWLSFSLVQIFSFIFAPKQDVLRGKSLIVGT